MRKEDLIREVFNLIREVFSSIKEITIYKDGYKNTFIFEKENMGCYRDPSKMNIEYIICSKLKKDEVFDMSLGDAYFYINDKPCCCNISQINYPMVEVRDNHEVFIIIEIDMANFHRGSVINDFYKCFQKYDGPIFENFEEIENRFEILDL